MIASSDCYCTHLCVVFCEPQLVLIVHIIRHEHLHGAEYASKDVRGKLASSEGADGYTSLRNNDPDTGSPRLLHCLRGEDILLAPDVRRSDGINLVVPPSASAGLQRGLIHRLVVSHHSYLGYGDGRRRSGRLEGKTIGLGSDFTGKHLTLYMA